MSRFFLKLIFIFFLFISNDTVFAKTLPLNNVDNLTIQMGNLSQTINLPRHDFAYEMTIPNEETSEGDPLKGTLAYSHIDIRTVIFRYDGYSINVNLKITDPALGNRIIWQGKVNYDKGLDKVVTIPEIVDDLHYIISINFIQPSQGRPQFIIGIVSL